MTEFQLNRLAQQAGLDGFYYLTEDRNKNLYLQKYGDSTVKIPMDSLQPSLYE